MQDLQSSILKNLRHVYPEDKLKSIISIIEKTPQELSLDQDDWNREVSMKLVKSCENGLHCGGCDDCNGLAFPFHHPDGSFVDNWEEFRSIVIAFIDEHCIEGNDEFADPPDMSVSDEDEDDEEDVIEPPPLPFLKLRGETIYLVDDQGAEVPFDVEQTAKLKDDPHSAIVRREAGFAPMWLRSFQDFFVPHDVEEDGSIRCAIKPGLPAFCRHILSIKREKELLSKLIEAAQARLHLLETKEPNEITGQLGHLPPNNRVSIAFNWSVHSE